MNLVNPNIREEKFEPIAKFYYDPTIALYPYTPNEIKLTWALHNNASFIPQEDLFWLNYSMYTYPIIGALALGGLAYYAIRKIEKVQVEREFEEVEQLLKNEPKIVANEAIAKKANKFKASSEAKKHDYLTYIEHKATPEDRLARQKAIKAKSSQRMKAITLIFLVSGFIQGRALARGPYYQYAKSKQDELEKIEFVINTPLPASEDKKIEP